MISNETKAYVAGIVDGEGCIDIYKHKAAPRSVRKYRYTMRLTVGMGRPELPNLLHLLYGGTLTVCKPENSNRSAEWRWRVSSNKAVSVLNDIFPYLRLKKKQATLAFSLQALQSGWRKQFGGIRTPDHIIEQEDAIWLELKAERGKKFYET